jgi:hypothetical protein
VKYPAQELAYQLSDMELHHHHNSLSQSFYQCRFSNTRFTNEQRIIFDRGRVPE